MLELKNICVNYSYKQVLRGLSLQFQEGKIYSLLGENGAGKSTLAHVICGDIKPTSGQLYLNGEKTVFSSPKVAIKAGIVCVHQRPLLSPSLSIADNLKIGTSKSQWKNKDGLLDFWLPGQKSTQLVKNLAPEDCFYVSLVGALMKNPKILIIDEPPAIPLEKLHFLTRQNLTIIMITHDLKEALGKSDRIILLQEGQILEEKDAGKITEDEIQKKLYGISKEAKLPASINIQKISEEQIHHQPGKIGLIPADKNFTASNPNLTIFQLLTAFHPAGKKKDLQLYAQNLLEKARVNIKLNEKVSALSGGMLGKLILERELSGNPQKIYLFKPTQGLDLEATERLYDRLDNLTKTGTQVIIAEEK